MTNRHNVHFIRAYITSAEEEIEHLINCTSTGASRNALCDANIHIKEALKKLEQYRESENGQKHGR